MHFYAQTNIQLLNQLRQSGYSNHELLSIANAYGLLMRLFTGRFRPSGKTFVAHLVGTASILAHLHVPSEVITAGLLHAAYSHGDFGGTGKRGISVAKREQVKQVVGQNVEEYIARYTTLRWKTDTVPTIYNQLQKLDPLDRQVVLIRLANELEERLDLGLLYCGDFKHQQYGTRDGHLMIEMAQQLGFPTLATQLEQAFQQTASEKLPAELCNPTGLGYSTLIIANSCQNRPLVSFYQIMTRAVDYGRSFAKTCKAALGRSFHGLTAKN
jgi:(p)ppGpp synthase/HD superfamily hydrolase